MIPTPVRAEIIRRVTNAETEHRVRVLLAVESGSRAWGFESPNSDFDARFIYVHDRDWYLSIDEKREVIEYPIVDEIDLNGWELRKALRLFRNSNHDPQLLADIDELLAQKRGSPEMGLAPQVASIHAFIEAELIRLEQIDIAQEGHTTPSSTGHLNELFVRCLRESSETGISF